MIRTNEEATKGWKKGELALPHEFKDLDAVHISPFVDLGRLLVVLVTRSILLSNTQYSLLLETDGRLLNLGSEWVGARVQYQKRAVCWSTMLALDDFEYTDILGVNNDECEYFVNGFLVNDRIYLQNFVFDSTFELKMDFEHIELEFNQLDENNKFHVSSNPYFAFHDDVFPMFAKNQQTQKKFSHHAVNKIVVVPENNFTSLQFFDHISTVLLDTNGAYIFSFELEMKNAISSAEFFKILEFRYLGGENLLSVDLFPNGSVQYSSVFLEEKIIDEKNLFYDEKTFLLKIDFEKLSISFLDNSEIGIKNNQTNSPGKEVAVNIYKYDRETAIRNFLLYKTTTQDYMLVLYENFDSLFRTSLISEDLSYSKEPFIKTHRIYQISESLHSVFRDRLHFFGGFNDPFWVRDYKNVFFLLFSKYHFEDSAT